jgi:hypothetical protein
MFAKWFDPPQRASTKRRKEGVVVACTCTHRQNGGRADRAGGGLLKSACNEFVVNAVSSDPEGSGREKEREKGVNELEMEENAALAAAAAAGDQIRNTK